MDSSFKIGVGPRTGEELQYLLERGLVVEEDGEYHEMSTVLDDSGNISIYDYDTQRYELPLVGVENLSDLQEEPNESYDNKENVEPPTVSDNSFNEQIEKKLELHVSPPRVYQVDAQFLQEIEGSEKSFQFENSLSTSKIDNVSFTISVTEADDPEEKACLEKPRESLPILHQVMEDNLGLEASILSTSEINNTSFTISVHEPEGCNMSPSKESWLLFRNEGKIQQETLDDNLQSELNPLSESTVNNRSFTILVNDSASSEKSYLGKSCSSGDMDDTMAAIEKLLALAEEDEANDLNNINPIEAQQFSEINNISVSNLLETHEEKQTIDVQEQDINETPDQFCSSTVAASSTCSRNVETPKSRENKTSKIDCGNLMYFTPLMPKRVLDLKRKGKFFSPSPPRPQPNASPPRGIKPNREFVQKDEILTPAKFCVKLLKNSKSEVREKRKTPNKLYADVNSPVKEYIHGRATPCMITKSKAICSVPIPTNKHREGVRISGVSSTTRIPQPKSSISTCIPKLSIGASAVVPLAERNSMSAKLPMSTGIPKPQMSSKGKFKMVSKEGSTKQRVRTENDESLSNSRIFSEAALRHTGLRNESGNASILMGNILKKQFYPITPTASTNSSKRNDI